MFAKMLTDNYQQIYVAAKRITQRNNQRNPKELISETYLVLEPKGIVPNNNIEFVMYFSKAMKYVYLGERSEYNKGVKPSDHFIEYDYGNDDWKQIELQAETTDTNTKDLIDNISHLTKEKAFKYIDLMYSKQTLSPSESELFKLHFEHGLSSRDIAKLLEEETGWKLSYGTFNRLINTMKTKLNGNN
jgi:hypothetical protein